MDLPVISEVDYKAFGDLTGSNLPDTYNEWLNLRSKWLVEYAKERPRDIKIYPDQFDRFLALTCRAHDMNSLLAFTEAVGRGESY
jgi:hypothetical protein